MGVGSLGGNKALLLDRDGVINRAIIREGRPYPPASVAEFEILPGVIEALTRSRALGFFNIVITNQPDVARGLQRRETVEAFNTVLVQTLPIDDIFVCYHDDADGCDCRKPLPGLVFQAAEKYELDLARSYVIGDRWRDIETGFAAGCRTILVDYGYRERAASRPADARVRSLLEAIAYLEIEQESHA